MKIPRSGAYGILGALAFLGSMFLSMPEWFACSAFAEMSKPAWNRVTGKSLAFFREKEFEFEIDDSVSQHYSKPTVEVSILVPLSFNDAGLTNSFYSAMILNDDISTDVQTHSRGIAA